MRITTKISWDWEGRILEWESFEYSGPLLLAKGDEEANHQRVEELNMQKQAFKVQMDQIAQLKGAFSKYLTQDIGFSPEQMSQMESSIQNQNTLNYNSAGQQVRSALASRGAGTGQLPVGGDYVRGLSGLMGAQASDLSNQQQGLKIQNAMQALTNRFNAGNLLSGNAATLTGTQGVAGSGASSALNSFLAAKNTGFLSSFANSFGSSLGSGLGAGITGGAGSAASTVGSGNFGW